MEATCWTALGNYQQSIHLCTRARQLLAMCGLSGGQLDHRIGNSQAEVHRLKSEYNEAAAIHSQIVQATSVKKESYNHAISLLNLSEIDVSRDVHKDDIEGNNYAAQTIFTLIGDSRLVLNCDVVQANLMLREGNISASEAVFKSCLKVSWGKYTDIVTLCLESLSQIGRTVSYFAPHWAITFLAYSVQTKQKLAIHKALQSLGKLCLCQEEETTAVSLFTAALDGYTDMDVHRGRAECMVSLGDISKRHGDMLKAVGQWREARPLFERSSQAKEVANIDERLAGVHQDVLNAYAEKLASLEKLVVPRDNSKNDESPGTGDLEDERKPSIAEA
ncbi:hypothetical protein DFH06DRAFT_1239404 [Mycena polygramma]|nr:hypothetical protein DFH06DRAFT_1239404 [Mycena polygramma]